MKQNHDLKFSISQEEKEKFEKIYSEFQNTFSKRVFTKLIFFFGINEFQNNIHNKKSPIFTLKGGINFKGKD